jgi:hypothetical protein
MDTGRYSLIQAEVRAQLDEIESVYRRIDSRRQAAGDPGVESLAYQLHNLYSAFEGSATFSDTRTAPDWIRGRSRSSSRTRILFGVDTRN